VAESIKVTARARQPLTRERIVAAALRIMDDEGLDAVSMRRIGRELGVEAMSLYNHVEDKHDILAGVKELVLGEFDMGPPSGDWEDDARRAARAWRRVLRAHPNVITLMTEARRPMLSVDGLRPSEIAFDILRRAGLDDAETARAFCAFGGYIMGFVLMEVGSMMGDPAVAGAPTPDEILRSLPAEELPRSCQVLPHLIAGDPDERFEYGLDLLIAGLRSRAAAPGAS
jgi:TetR/AcrR family tetracycline transcriptional repressor